MTSTRPARRCLTAAECFAAGWDDGATDKPLTPQETERLARLHGPYLRQTDEAHAS